MINEIGILQLCGLPVVKASFMPYKNTRNGEMIDHQIVGGILFASEDYIDKLKEQYAVSATKSINPQIHS